MWNKAAWDPRMRPYVVYSVGLHFILGLLCLNFLLGGAAKETKIYSIDFISDAATVVGPSGPAAQASASSVATAAAIPVKAVAATRPPIPKTTEQPDDISTTRRRRKFVLPPPSLLGGMHVAPQATPSLPSPTVNAPANTGPATTATAAGDAGTPGEAGIATDMPDFPYPWYITQVRSLLWNRWMMRTNHDAGQAVVVFTIMPDGQVVGIQTEESSGNEAFDLSALGAVQDASPFPALPQGFKDPFLRVHATLKSS
jgi:protein TonB